MKQKTKKIIAREFLILLGTAILFFIIVGGWSFLEYRNGEKEKKYENQITQIIEKTKNEPLKLEVFHYFNTEVYGSGKIDNLNEFINADLSNEYTNGMYDLIENDTYHSLKKPTEDLNKEEFYNKLKNDNNSKLILKEVEPIYNRLVETQKSILHKNFIDTEAIISILFFVFFITRYLIYTIKWSLIQLKKAD
jgi:hypothetical protein